MKKTRFTEEQMVSILREADQRSVCLAIDVAGGIRSGHVIEGLSRLVSLHGALPKLVENEAGNGRDQR